MDSKVPAKNSASPVVGETVQKAVKVLVVEKDPVSRQLLCRLLEKEGYPICVAESWSKVADQIHSFFPHVVILGQVETELTLQCQVDSIRNEGGPPEIRILAIEQKDERPPAGATILGRPLDWRGLREILEGTSGDLIRKTALLINPDALFNGVLARQFARLGWVVETAPHIQAAQNYLKSHSTDLLFMETQMGIRDILKVVRAAPEAPFFLLATSKLNPDEEDQLMDFNPVVFKQGHFSLRELRDALESLNSKGL